MCPDGAACDARRSAVTELEGARGVRRREHERRRRLLRDCTRREGLAAAACRESPACRCAATAPSTGGEKCDDSNTTSGDGCSIDLSGRAGRDLPEEHRRAGAGKVLHQRSAATAMKEAGEGCDCGTDPTKLPAGCTGPNGLFNGDGTGCSKTCTKEPICRDASGKTQACATSCGNGNIETGEDCDDGNRVGGDGCSSTCKIESGFSCDDEAEARTRSPARSPATPASASSCRSSTATSRTRASPAATPTSSIYGATIPNPVTRQRRSRPREPDLVQQALLRPQLGGPGASKNDSTARCWDIAQANLDANGRPAVQHARGRAARPCDCQFTDWSHDGNGGNTSPATAIDLDSGRSAASPTSAARSGHPGVQGASAPVVTSATTFGQWWQDGTWESDGDDGRQARHRHPRARRRSTAARRTSIGSPARRTACGAASSRSIRRRTTSRSTRRPAAPAGPGAVQTTPAAWTEPLLCNIWPYWYSSASFGGGQRLQGRPVRLRRPPTARRSPPTRRPGSG